MSPYKRGRRFWPFFLSGGLLAIAMNYPQTLWAFSFVFLIPILHFREAHFSRISGWHELLHVFSKMFLFSFVFVALSTLWFLSAYPLDWLNIDDPVLGAGIIASVWVAFVLVMSFPTAFWIVFVSVLRTKNIFIDAIIGASGWVAVEYARSWFVVAGIYGSEVLLGPHHTYYSLAYTVSSVPFVRDLLPVGGIYLTSFVIILANYFFYSLFRLWKHSFESRNAIFSLVILLFGIVCGSALGMEALRNRSETAGNFVSIVVDTDLPSASDKRIQEGKRVFALQLFDRMADSSGEVVFFPENFNVMPPYTDESRRKTIREKSLIVSSFSGERFYNMFFLNPKNENRAYYRKQLLMPLGEYDPSLVRFLVRLTGNDRWIETYDTIVFFLTAKKGGHQLPYKDESIAGLVIGGSLCSENISPYIFRDATKFGATVLVNIASLSPFHGANLLTRQTLAINTARALENGRYFVTASNFGESFIVDDAGNIIKRSSSGNSNQPFFRSQTEMKTYQTPYVSYGDYMVPVAFSCLMAAFVWLGRRKRQE